MSLPTARGEPPQGTDGSPNSNGATAAMEIYPLDMVGLVLKWMQPAALVDPDGRIVAWSRQAEELYGRLQEEVTGTLWTDLVGEPSFREEPPRAASLHSHRFNADHISADRGPIRVGITRTDLPVPGSDSCYCLYLLHELTESRMLRNRLEQRVAELSIIREIGEVLQSAMSLEKILHVILVGATAGQGLSFNRAFLLLADTETGTLRGRAAVGPSSPKRAAAIWSELSGSGRGLRELLRNIPGDFMANNRRVNRIVGELYGNLDDENDFLVCAFRSPCTIRVEQGIDRQTGMEVDPGLLEKLGIDSLVAVPLVADNRHVGLLLADNAITGKPVSRQEIKVLELLGMQAAMAIRRSQLTEELEAQAAALEKAFQESRENQARLIEAERLATLGQMSASLAHEIRNPLVAVGGFARSLLEMGDRSGAERQQLEIISNEVKRLERIVNRVLAFTQDPEPRRQVIDLAQIASEAFNLLQWEIDRSGVIGRLEVENIISLVEGDRDQLLQALINLMQNGIQAMSEGGMLTLRLKTTGGWVALEVEDTGAGMSEEDRASVFQPFYTTKGNGTGLGLPIVMQIVNSHHGQIEIESREGQGTAVRLSLPGIDRTEEDN